VGKLIKKNGACKREEVLMLLDGKLLRIVTEHGCLGKSGKYSVKKPERVGCRKVG
jgi:hypothetical protein